VKTANNKRQRLGQAVIPEKVKCIRELSMCAVTLDTASRKLDWPTKMSNICIICQVFYDEEGTMSADAMTFI